MHLFGVILKKSKVVHGDFDPTVHFWAPKLKPKTGFIKMVS